MELTKAKTWEYKTEVDWKDVEERWKVKTISWNIEDGLAIEMDKNRRNTVKTKGFAGLVLFYAIFPYKTLKTCPFEHFYAQHIWTVIWYYNQLDSPTPPFKDMVDYDNPLTGPLLPAAYREWINREIDSASW